MDNIAVFCTGSSGLVASDFKNLCLSKNIPFFGIDLSGEGESVDITNYDQLLVYFKKLTTSVVSSEVKKSFPIVFHFAAITFTGNNLTSEQIDLSKKVNIEGTRNIVKVCENLNLPLVHISTDFVFSGASKQTPYLPNDPLKPDDTVYSQTKAEAEKIVSNSKLNKKVIIRIAFPYGNFTHPKKGLARKMLEWMDNNPEVNLYSDQTICPTPTSLISEACLKVVHYLIQNNKVDQIFHVTGKPISPYDFGQLIKQIFKKNVKLNKTSTPSNTYKYMVLDSAETEKLLNLKIPDHLLELQKLNEYSN